MRRPSAAGEQAPTPRTQAHGAGRSDSSGATHSRSSIDRMEDAHDHSFPTAGAAHHRPSRSLSLSLPWRRPKVIQREFPHNSHQLNDVAVDDEPDHETRAGVEAETEADLNTRPRGLSHGHTTHHNASIRGMFRRASISLRSMVHRLPTVQAEEAPCEEHTPTQHRPTTSHLLGTRSRPPVSLRSTRSFYGLDYTKEPLPMSSRPIHTSHHSSRSRLASEPPVVPRNTGHAAKASAAQQNEFLARAGLQNRWLHNAVSDDNNDDESGVGISVTVPDAWEAQISKVDFVTKLPTELAIHVLGYLNAITLGNASLVCREWKQIVADQHIWRESCLRETTGTYAMSGPVRPNVGLGVPRNHPETDWKQIYRVKRDLEQKWKEGTARPVYLNGHTDSIYCLQFDEHKIITGSRDRTIRIWDMHTLECRLIIGPPDIVQNDDILHDENDEPVHYAADSEGGRMKTSVPEPLSFSEFHNASILCLQYDNKILATGSSDATCIVYDIQAGYQPIHRLRHHKAAILDLAFDDKHIVTCSKDISICVWDRETGALLRQLRGHTGPVNAVQMRGNTIVSCSGDFRVNLWNIDTGKNIREFVGHTKGLACSQFSEDGRYVASAGNDKTIRIWDANTGECLRDIRAHDNLVRSLHIDSVSGRLVSGSYDTDIKVWDMETGRQLLDFPQWHKSWVLSAKSDYRRIVSTGQDPKILIMDFGAKVEGIEMLESENKLTSRAA